MGALGWLLASVHRRLAPEVVRNFVFSALLLPLCMHTMSLDAHNDFLVIGRQLYYLPCVLALCLHSVMCRLAQLNLMPFLNILSEMCLYDLYLSFSIFSSSATI